MKKFSEVTKVNEDVTEGSVNPNENKGTRVLLVKGSDNNPDYAASEFEMVYRGENVTNIMNNPNDYLDPKFSDAEWVLEVLEFGPVDKAFVDFLYSSDMFDYDRAKDKNIYFDGQVLK